VSLDVAIQWAAHEVATELVPDQAQIRRWVRVALRGRYEDAQLTVRVVGYEESRQLNETYRHRQGPTNVLSFPFEQPGMVTPPLLGDVVISAPLAVQEASEQGKELMAHWAHLVIHGVLHLIGYDHLDEDEAGIMEELECNIMMELRYPDPYEKDEVI